MIAWNLQVLDKLRKFFFNWIPAFAGMTAVIFISLFIFTRSSFAANEFSTSYDIIYSVSEDGTTEVTENIKLKNLTDKFFPSSFSVTLPGSSVFEISATDKQGELEVNSTVEGANTKVSVNFTNTQIIGLNKEYLWTLKFRDKSIARSLGKVWNVNLPKISQQTQVENLNLTLSVPTSFGDPDFISPKPSRISESGGRINLSFTKNELLTSGISAIFGSELSFEFETSSILSHRGLFPKYFSLVIPGNSAYQKAYIQNIEPRPENVFKDNLGNILASFKVSPGQTYEVKVKGNLKTFLKSQSKDVISEAERQMYSADSKFWDKSNPNIKVKLSEIFQEKSPQSNFEKARLIDKYVSNFLQFDESRIEKNDFIRFGSITALNNPEKALAVEFVDLESALLRASDIPTRQIIGFALKSGASKQSLRGDPLKPFSYSNQNLHTWLEFYDTNSGWVIADPAWENTTSGADFFAFNDLNHLILGYSNGEENFIAGRASLINGQASLILPTNVETKIYEGELYEEKGAELDVKVDSEILSGFPSSARIRINNLGNAPFPATTLEITTSKILLEFPNNQPLTTKLINTPEIPPFGNLEYNFNLKTGAIWHSYQDAFQVKFAGVDDTRVITVSPILSYKIFAIEIFGALVMIALFYILVLLIHHKSAKKS